MLRCASFFTGHQASVWAGQVFCVGVEAGGDGSL